VILRTSFVLGRDRGAGCGALAKLRLLVKLGLGGKVGSGTQGISWIHEADLCRLFERALCDVTMHGAYIASAPRPVSQREFMRVLRRTLRVPIGLPALPWMVRVGARWLLRTDPELALYGRYVVSTRLADEGFTFQFPQLADALADVCLHRGCALQATRSAAAAAS
jgi:NAD dependent epimerase/dehydratase family enzyme